MQNIANNGARVNSSTPAKGGSPFGKTATQALEAGYSPLPLVGKKPIMDEWSNHCEAPVTEAQIRKILSSTRQPLNIGVACGYNGLIGMDFDTNCQKVMAIVRKHLPESFVTKRGLNGYTAFYFDPSGELTCRRLNGPAAPGKPLGVRIIDVLAKGTQTVVPPSIHPGELDEDATKQAGRPVYVPGTSRPYEWGDQNLFDHTPEDLPVVTRAMLDALEAELRAEGLLYVRPEKAVEFKPRASKQAPSEVEKRRYRAWVEAKIKSACAELATMGAKSGRNALANKLVFTTGAFVHHDIIKLSELVDPIVAACEANGLNKENGKNDLMGTISRALHACNASPLPELQDRPKEGKARTAAKQANPPAKYSAPVPERPMIQIVPGKLSEMATTVEEHLIAAEVPFFTRGSKVVRPIVEDLADAEGRVTKSAAFVEVEATSLRDAMCANISWQRYVRREKEWVDADAPKEVAEIVLSRRGEWNFRPVSGVISTPTLRPDGSILSTPGYDEKTRLVLMGGVTLPAMPEKPTKADAMKALALLDDLLTEFPFVDEASKSVARSALITPVVRGAFAVSPMHVSRAPTAGTGKSYIFDTAAAIALGHTCPVMAAGRNEEETEKRLGSSALAGHPIINIDNVNGELGGDALCQLVERPICDIRVLGQSKQERLVNRFTVFATGNNIRLVGDMTRRAILCSLDAQMEKPAERKFKKNPVKMVLKNRGAYVAACLTIVRAYHLAGRPEVASPPMNSFEGWSDNVRSALVWLGCADPVETVNVARAEDPELQSLTEFMDAFKEAFGVGKGEARTIAQVIASSEERGLGGDRRHQSLHNVLAQWARAGQVNSRSFGKWLSDKKDRVIAGHKLMSKPSRVGSQAWYIEKQQ